MAERLGISRGYMCEIVSGAKRPSVEIVYAIFRATEGAVTLESWFDESAVA